MPRGIIFFFQAEAGIRGVAVTGVQKCALPIFPVRRPEPGSPRTPGRERLLAGSHERLADLFKPRYTSGRSEEHTSELQSRLHLVCRLLLEKKKHKQPSSVSATQNPLSIASRHR